MHTDAIVNNTLETIYVFNTAADANSTADIPKRREEVKYDLFFFITY